MLLHEKLSALQRALNIKNAELARESGLDAASVSRFLLGKRLFPYRYLPLLCATMARMFPQGVEGASLPPELREMTGEGLVTHEELSQATLTWLKDSPEYEKKQSKAGRKPKSKDSSASQKVFGEKLSLLMDTAAISGSQLAGALYVDPSTVYKYRVGVRSPKKDILEGIVGYVASRVRDEAGRRRILEAAGGNPDMVDMAPGDFRSWMMEWLSEEHTLDTSAIESLLETIDDFSYFGGGAGVIPLEEIAPLAGDVARDESFWGVEGMRAAATRYLYYATTLEAPTTLYICTSSSLDFVTMDAHWKAVWASLMIHCLVKGHTVKIIYNMADRSVAEIMEAIEAFVPLYMVGRMEPYAFKSPQGTTVRHTTFLIENHAVVTANYAEGMDDEAEYVYSTEPRRLAVQKKHFDALLAASGRLMDIYRSDDAESFDIRLGRFWGLHGNATLLLPSLSLATLPETLLASMLRRAARNEATREKILALHATEKRWFDLQLDRGVLTELSVVADKETLAAEEVLLDVPAHLATIPYTREEYAAHLAHVRRLDKRRSNYHFHELEASPFRNTKVYYKSAEVIVQKAGVPSAAFAIDNVYMCRGFGQFLPRLEGK